MKELLPDLLVVGVGHKEVVRQVVISEVPDEVPIDVLVVFPKQFWSDLLAVPIAVVQLHALLKELTQLDRVD